MAQKKHFRGVGKEKIHTSREGTCELKGACNYADNAPQKPPFPKLPRQAHHILCVSSTIGYKTNQDYVGYVLAIDAVYKNTEWCVNQKPNLVWLPLKGTYTKGANDPGTRDKPGSSWDLNLPCHDWDHNCSGGYTDEVRAAFKSEIWNDLKAAKKAGECPEDSDVQAAIKNLESNFRDKVSQRGTRQGGTRSAILKEGERNWWLPFSMAKATVARVRVVRAFGRKPEPLKALTR